MIIENKIHNNIGLTLKGGEIIVVVAGSKLELDDKLYLQAKKAFAPLVKAGDLAIIKDAELSPEDQAKEQAAKLAEARAFIAKVEAESKASKAKA